MAQKIKLPKGINKDAKSYINDIIKMLEKKGLLDNVDTAALLMLAHNLSMFIEASNVLEKEGLFISSDRGNMSEHPAVRIAKDAQIQSLRLMQEFGLTCNSRYKMKMSQPVEDTEESPLERFFKKQ